MGLSLQLRMIALCLFATGLWPVVGTASNKTCRGLSERIYQNLSEIEVKSLEHLKHVFLNRARISTRRQNLRFKRSYAHDEEKTAIILFPIVGQLNRHFSDKEVTASLFNLYKEILVRELEPLIRDERVSIEYSDYKSIGLRIHDSSTRLIHDLERIRNRISTRFLEITDNIADLRRLDSSDRSIIQNRQAWFHWGIGRSGREAWASARASRLITPSGGPMSVQHYDSPHIQELLRKKLDETELLRLRVVQALLSMGQKGQALLYRENVDSQWVPSTLLWEITRKVDAYDEASYISEVKRRLREAYSLEVSEVFVKNLQSYLHHLELFQPMIFQKIEQINLGVSASQGPVFYFDIRMQADRNLLRESIILERASKERQDEDALTILDRSIHALMDGQKQESRRFAKLMKHIPYVLRTSGVSYQKLESGDEMAVALSESLSPRQVRGILTGLGDAGGYGNYRPVLVHSHGDSPRSGDIAEGEKIEKGIRERLKTSNRMRMVDWNHLMIGVEIIPGHDTSAVRIYLIEKPGANIVSRIRPWVQSMLANPSSSILPPGYVYLDLISN